MDIAKRIDDPDLLKFNDLVKGIRWSEILHSVKLNSGKTNKNRILYGINSSSIRYSAIVKILTELKFPFNKFPELESYYYDSYDIGVSLEKSSTGELNYRIYFEKNYTTPEMHKMIEKMIAINNNHHFPIIKGFKWNIDSPQDIVVTEYDSLVNYSANELVAHMTSKNAYVPDFVKKKFSECADAEAISKNYRPMQAYEIKTGRMSFDIGFEKDTVYTKDVCDSAMDTRYKLNLTEVLVEFNDVSIGHIATGRDKNGEDFLTIYYSIQ